MNYWTEKLLQEQLRQKMFNQIGISATRQGITNPCGEIFLTGTGGEGFKGKDFNSLFYIEETNRKLLLL